MNSSFAALPEGRAGQTVAVLLPLLALALLWVGLVAPLASWFGARADQLAVERQEIARGDALAQALPAMRAAANAAQPDDASALLLAGASDDEASTNLQTALQALAAPTGTALDSATPLPTVTQGPLRRIGVQVSLTAPWPAVIALLQAIDTASPRLVVGDFSASSPGPDVPLAVSFTVSAFRTGAP